MTRKTQYTGKKCDIQSLENRRLFSLSPAAILTNMLAPIGTDTVIVTPAVTTVATTPVTPTVPVTTTPTTTNPRSGITPVITLLDDSIMVHQGVHVQATNTALASGSLLTAALAWDFGDAAGQHNALDGFNAGHVYDQPGVYTITLKVTNDAGTTATATKTLTVTPDTRTKVYVSRAGSDTANTGLSEASPFATLAKAIAYAPSNSEILLRRGDSWDLTNQVTVNGANVLIGAYGNPAAARPILVRANPAVQNLIGTSATTRDLTVQDLNFDSATPADLNKTGAARGVYAVGTNIVVRNSTVSNVTDFVNGELRPTGVLVMDNATNSDTSVRAYFTWCQGSDWSIVGNNISNSTREHIVRSGGTDRLQAEYNTFGNISRVAQGDPQDIAKATFNLQVGSYMTVQSNTLVDGPTGVGPLGGVDGSKLPYTNRNNNVVFRKNTLSDATMNVTTGVANVLLEDNVVTYNGGIAIWIAPVDTYSLNGVQIFGDRKVENLIIRNNTAFNTSATGRFLAVNAQGVANSITLTSNLYVAPNLAPGSNQIATVYVQAPDLSMFKSISNNIWNQPAGNAGKTMYVYSTWWNASGYLASSAWEATDQVSNDVFSNVAITPPAPPAAPGGPANLTAPGADYTATVNSITAGSRLRR